MCKMLPTSIGVEGYKTTLVVGGAPQVYALGQIATTLCKLPTPNTGIAQWADFNLPGGTPNKFSSSGELKMAKSLMTSQVKFCIAIYYEPNSSACNTLDLCFSNSPAFVHSYWCCKNGLRSLYSRGTYYLQYYHSIWRNVSWASFMLWRISYIRTVCSTACLNSVLGMR